jgi:tetratricopeptide (TPR) repeat protein
MRKKIFFTVILMAAFVMLGQPLARAERIFYKDGRTLDVKVLYLKEGSLWVKHRLGAVAIKVKDIECIQNDDGSISGYDFKGLCQSILDSTSGGDYRTAVAGCTQLLQTFPDDRLLRYLRAVLNQKLGSYDKATEDYLFLVEKGFADIAVYNNLGYIYARNKDYRKAAEYFTLASEKDPDLPQLHHNLAEALLQMKDYPQAIEEFNKVIQAQPDNSQVLYNLGLAYLNSGNYRQAKQSWEKLLALNPQDESVKGALEYLRGRKE